MTNVEKLKAGSYGQYEDVVEYVKENFMVEDADDYINSCMSEIEIIEAWLFWNGILGYSARIIDLVETVKGYRK